ncbi:ABC transporter permease [Marivirga harenae]|uniref:ABC transporter permease n=1 Tax=Marivirga harenae TaxID=2010992 RepID=UPI0026E07DB1|nr:ABC transporter permease [Marivirga harenae]WKV10619.1 ABC transporter permease [Marivirga harenae]
MKPAPPKLAQKLLKSFLREELAEEVLGDLEENFHSRVENRSLMKAKINYWFQVINYLRPFAIQKSKSYNSNYTDMFKINFKIGYRNLLRNKGYSSINIGGLAVGMAVAMLISLWVYDELTFDSYHENHDRIAQVMKHQQLNDEISMQAALPIPLKEELQSNYGEGFDKMVLAYWPQNLIISHEDTKMTSIGNFIEKDVIEMFSIHMLKGDEKALTEPGSIIISSKLSYALFKDERPVGKMMKIDNELEVMVTGVYADFPKNSSFYGINFFAPWKLYQNSQDWIREAAVTNDWGNNSFQIFAELAQDTDLESLNQQIKRAGYSHISEEEKAQKPEVFLHPMNDWHLKSSWENGVQSGGLIKFVKLFAIIAGLVLLLACINFMNLSTAQSERRAKEVGVRKAIGSRRGQLVNQFLIESFLVVIISFVLSFCIVLIALPFFNELVDKDIQLPLSSLYFWIFCGSFIFGTALLSGSYPAFYLSSFRPISVLKGSFKAGPSSLMLRKVLVVLQFSASIVLIIGTLFIQKQVEFAKDRPMGYDAEGTIMLWSNSADFTGKFDVLRNELKSKGAIVELSESSSPLTQIFSRTSNLSWEGKDNNYDVDFGKIAVTPEYGKTINWNIIKGRDFSRDITSDLQAVILNEKAVREMGIADPIGKIIRSGSGEKTKELRVIGVIENLIIQSPFDEVTPIIFSMSNSPMNCMTMRLNPEQSTSASIAIIEDVFKEQLPSTPLDFTFTDEQHGLKFASEERFGSVAGLFALLAIFISCLGIFGMASFVAEQRTKEIGVRKVLGASVLSIWKMITQSFLVLVGLSCLVAIPIAYYLVSGWLEGFQYKTNLHWSVFAIAGVGAIVITLVTVSYHAISSALGNPIKSLKAE